MGKKKSIIVLSLAAGAFVLLAVQNFLNTKKINELQNQISNQINDFEVSVNTNLTAYQQQVEAQQKLLCETADYVKSQTAIISRIVGENIPVIIPSEYREKFDDLKKSADSAFLNKKTDDAQQLSEDYLEYIRQAPSWMQNEQSSELFSIHSEIEYLTILYDYNQNEELERTIDELQNFIITENSFSQIDLVIAEYNRLVDLQNANYDAAISKAVNNASAAISDFDNSKNVGTLENALSELSLYGSDEKVSELIAQITKLIEEYQTADYLKKIDDYNEWAITLLDHCNRTNNSIETSLPKGFLGFGGASDVEKETAKDRKKDLLKNLETVDTNLLITPVNSLYQQVYSVIWNSLEQKDQFEVSRLSVLCTKRGLSNE